MHTKLRMCCFICCWWPLWASGKMRDLSVGMWEVCQESHSHESHFHIFPKSQLSFCHFVNIPKDFLLSCKIFWVWTTNYCSRACGTKLILIIFLGHFSHTIENLKKYIGWGGWRDGSVVKSIACSSKVQFPATIWCLTTIYNEVWCPLLTCRHTHRQNIVYIVNK